MSKNTFSNTYDDDNIPEVDLPRNTTDSNASNSFTNSQSNLTSNQSTSKTTATAKQNYNVEPLPESSRPRKDGPGGA